MQQSTLSGIIIFICLMSVKGMYLTFLNNNYDINQFMYPTIFVVGYI